MSPLENTHHRPLPDLQTGDIIVVQHKKNFTRKLLRSIYRSYWDHTALVLFPKDPQNGFSSNIIIEAIQYGLNSSLRRGVEIHRLERYLNRPDLFDIGILRMRYLNAEIQKRVRSYMLLNVDTPYYPLTTYRFILAWLFPSYKRRLMERQRYSCSSLIQKAFYEAVNWSERPHVTFRGNGFSPLELQELTSPADIARSPICKWLWNKH